jgi:hypothetical protein
MADKWLVLKCAACNICHGRKSTGHDCPHCGQRMNSNSVVVDTAKDSSDLRIKVALANTPEELRELLKVKLSKENLLVENNFNAVVGVKIIRESANLEGMIYKEEITDKLSRSGMEIDVDLFMESVESQGLIIRIASGIWQFLE